MSTYTLGYTFENIRTITVMFLDIFILWLVIYYALKLVRNNNRTIQIFKGVLFIIFVDLIAKFLGLKTVQFLADIFVNWGFLAIIIIFQPEIRNLLERMGKSNIFSRITTLTGNEKENLVDNIVTAVMLLSKDQTGALISLEQGQSLEDFIQTGTRLNSDVTAELLTSIFVTSTPLHDGAVIIQGDKIACASAYFPPTNMDLPSRYGARHRAAIGISEISDAVTIVVSEETGAVSITEGGQIIPVTRESLRNYLLRVILGETTEVRTPKRPAIEVEPESEPAKKRGMFSKLVIRKQETNVSPAKVETEEVKPAVKDRKLTRKERAEEKRREKAAEKAAKQEAKEARLEAKKEAKREAMKKSAPQPEMPAAKPVSQQAAPQPEIASAKPISQHTAPLPKVSATQSIPVQKPAETRTSAISVSSTQSIPKQPAITDTQKFSQVDAEAKAAEIKLPHKKKRPAASYPKQQERVVPTMPKRENSNPASLDDLILPPTSRSELSNRDRNTSSLPRAPRMTAEDVKKAREAQLKNLSHNPGTSAVPAPIPKPAEINKPIERELETVRSRQRRRTPSASKNGGDNA